MTLSQSKEWYARHFALEDAGHVGAGILTKAQPRKKPPERRVQKFKVVSSKTAVARPTLRMSGLAAKLATRA